MDNFVERIAYYADADTRRVLGFGDIDKRLALGFPPRRLVLPDIKLILPLVREALPFRAGYGPPKPIAQQNLSTGRYLYVVNFENGIELHIHPVVMAEYWYFHEKPGDFQYKTEYSFMYDSKDVTVCTSRMWKHDTHPDFNEDGTFKRWQTV
jgi:hypothetical protein